MNNKNLQELDWTAFCYVTGELSEAEEIQFEELLANDQPAREAVARAVELGQSISASQQIEVQRETTTSPKAAALAGGFIVASILGFLVFTMNPWGNHPLNNDPTPQPPQTSPANQALALTWSETKSEFDDNFAVEESDELEDEAEDLSIDSLAQEESSFDAPLWMLTAVSIQQKALEESESIEMEN